MSDLARLQQAVQPFDVGGRRLPTTTNRALSQVEHRAVVTAARVHAQAALGREAMFAVADLSELEGQLATLCPLATSRLEAIANATAVSIARMVIGFECH